MRLNQYIALQTGLSRRKADELIEDGQVFVNDTKASLGQTVSDEDTIKVDNKVLEPHAMLTTIILNKPVDYIVSRGGQGSKTIYELLPPELHQLKPVGRLDKDSSGLLLLTNDGELANKLTHPRYQKEKVYEIELDRDLSKKDFEIITKKGVQLEDGPSKLKLDYIDEGNIKWKVTMSEGRNRQIRRTFAALGYRVKKLHRIQFGEYELKDLKSGSFKIL